LPDVRSESVIKDGCEIRLGGVVSEGCYEILMWSLLQSVQLLHINGGCIIAIHVPHSNVTALKVFLTAALKLIVLQLLCAWNRTRKT